MSAVACRDLGIRFLRGSQRAILRGTLRKAFQLPAGRRAGGGAHERWALRHVDLELPSGARLGICGNNGSGKTTLMRIMSGIYLPDEGSIHVEGRTSALLSIGAGISIGLSGHENLLLMGAIHGVGRRELMEHYAEMQRFSGLDDETLQTPVRYYSAGMRARLAFAIYAVLTPEVLLIDEILSVGDAEFSRRSGERLSQLARDAACVVLSSHNLNFLRESCDRGLWLHEGRVMALGEIDQVVEEYRSFAKNRI